MKIAISNTEKLNAALEKIQGPRVSARTISADDIEEMVERIEKRLSTMLHKKDWQGLEFNCDPNAQSFPGAYKGMPESTQFTLERGQSDWFVIDIGRYITRGPSNLVVPLKMDRKALRLVEFAASAKAWGATQQHWRQPK